MIIQYIKEMEWSSQPFRLNYYKSHFYTLRSVYELDTNYILYFIPESIENFDE